MLWSYTKTESFMYSLKLVVDRQTDRQTDRPTDGPTDMMAYRAAIAAKNTIYEVTLYIQGVYKKLQDKEMERLHTIILIIFSSYEKYLCSKKTEVSLVVLHIITFRSSY